MGGNGASVWDDGRFWGWMVVETVEPGACPWCHSVTCSNVVQVVNFMLHIFYHNEKWHIFYHNKKISVAYILPHKEIQPNQTSQQRHRPSRAPSQPLLLSPGPSASLSHASGLHGRGAGIRAPQATGDSSLLGALEPWVQRKSLDSDSRLLTSL